MKQTVETNLKLLIIDDDKDLLKQMHIILKNIGYEHIVDVSSIEGAEQYLGTITSVRLIVINWDMKGGMAEEFVKNLLAKEAMKSISVIMATHSNRQITILNAIRVGVKQCLLRPILQKTLEDSLIWLMEEKCEKAKEHLSETLAEISSLNLDEGKENTRRKCAYDETIAIIKEATALYPWRALPHYELGLIYDENGSLNQAVKTFELALSFEPKHTKVSIALASTFRKRKQWNRIVKVLVGFSHGKTSATILELLGEAYLMTGETNKAIKTFNDAILHGTYAQKSHALHDRNIAKAHESLGKAYEEKSKETKDKNWQDRAIKSFEESVHYDPVLISAHLNLVSAYKKNGNLEKAAAALKNVAEVTPNSSEDWISLGRLYLMENEEPKALFAMKRGLSMSDHRHQTLFEIGEALLPFDQEKAISAFRNSLKIDLDQPHVFNKLGILYRKKGMLKEALDSYLQAIQLDPKDETIHYNLAGVYLANKSDPKARAEAVTHLRKAIELKEEFKEAKELLSQLGVE